MIVGRHPPRLERDIAAIGRNATAQGPRLLSQEFGLRGIVDDFVEFAIDVVEKLRVTSVSAPRIIVRGRLSAAPCGPAARGGLRAVHANLQFGHQLKHFQQSANRHRGYGQSLSRTHLDKSDGGQSFQRFAHGCA